MEKRVLKLTQIQKVTNQYQDFTKSSGKIEYENNKRKMEILITERTHITPGENGLDGNMQTDIRTNSMGREQSKQN